MCKADEITHEAIRRHVAINNQVIDFFSWKIWNGEYEEQINTKKQLLEENQALKEEKKAMVESGTTDLARDLCKMAVSANLPWNVFNNPIVREILEKHMGKKLPCADTISGRVNELYKEIFEDIKKDLAGKPFWLATDETNGM